VTITQWVVYTYGKIPESKRQYYSSDTLIASVCFYRTKKGLYPTCLSEAEAIAYVETLVRVADKSGETVEDMLKKTPTEKSVKHDMKRNLMDGTMVDALFNKCSNYLQTEGYDKTQEEKVETLQQLLIDSGVVEKEAAERLGSKIIQQQNNPQKKKDVNKSNSYKEIRIKRFLTAQEREAVKKRSIKLTQRPNLTIDRDLWLRLVDEIINLIEEIKTISENGGNENESQ
jgi:hypothetical protein